MSPIASFPFPLPRCVCSSCSVSSLLFAFVVIGIVFVVRACCLVIVSVVRLVRFWLRPFSVRALSRFVFIVRVLAYRRYRSGCVRCLFVFVFRWFMFDRCVRVSYRAVRKITLVYVRCCVISHWRYGSIRSIVVRLFSVRVGVCLWDVPLSLYRSVVILLRSFGSLTLVAFVSRFPLLFSYRRLVGSSLSCTVRMNIS